MDFWSLVVYAVPVVLITLVYLIRRRRTHVHHSRILEDSVSAGMTEPASLHPLIDESKCLGCGACVTACPETSHHDVLGLINGKAVLIGPYRVHRARRMQNGLPVRRHHAWCSAPSGAGSIFRS